MKIRKIKTRGILFTFYELGIATNIYVILLKDKYIFIDTYLGKTYIKDIAGYLISNYGKREFIAVNTHSDWDHIWGNEFFDKIYGHNNMISELKRKAAFELEDNASYIKEKINLKYPNITFENELEIEDVFLKYTPGHSIDSISIIDRKDKILYAGDNIERPLPYIQWKEIDSYIESLIYYLSLDVDIVIGGHTDIEDKALIIKNLEYLKNISKRDLFLNENIEKKIHKENLKFLKLQEG